MNNMIEMNKELMINNNMIENDQIEEEMNWMSWTIRCR